jgi:hypothetical protein
MGWLPVRFETFSLVDIDLRYLIFSPVSQFSLQLHYQLVPFLLFVFPEPWILIKQGFLTRAPFKSLHSAGASLPSKPLR